MKEEREHRREEKERREREEEKRENRQRDNQIRIFFVHGSLSLTHLPKHHN